MNKSLKLFSRMSCGVIFLWLNGLMAADVFAQPKPADPTYTFFQGLTFPPFPGTIPRPAYGTAGSSAPIFPLVEVPTPGIATAREPNARLQIRRRKPRVVQQEPIQPVRRRRVPRVNSNNN